MIALFVRMFSHLELSWFLIFLIFYLSGMFLISLCVCVCACVRVHLQTCLCEIFVFCFSMQVWFCSLLVCQQLATYFKWISFTELKTCTVARWLVWNWQASWVAGHPPKMSFWRLLAFWPWREVPAPLWSISDLVLTPFPAQVSVWCILDRRDIWPIAAFLPGICWP